MSEQICEGCAMLAHGICHKYGSPRSGGDKACSPWVVRLDNSVPTGWICPVCGRGLAPDTKVCPCKDAQLNVKPFTGSTWPTAPWNGDPEVVPLRATETGDL